jgi:hypothetical protein
MQIDSGNFSWGSEVVTRKTRILGVAYNATSNEFIRTATLVKNTIVQIDATPFRQFYEQHYGVTVGKKTKKVLYIFPGLLVRMKKPKRKFLRKNKPSTKRDKKVTP